ncbi:MULTISPECIES: GntR family transcriptional regulator [unclassified Oceanispirochaeta]|uniref:GntR family transcriptional regulator n=1 Tax=unclassified Oceanispirochaeta TaxID=2635722 RepID=UPI000E09CB89|nr:MULTISPECIES: GntR family transcriptional regulator [unclassified Oceanispirochaeta]MBF9014489.1 GntR family transcriptional regulator [Oceanispirochaeta sp. M2]NPD70745.1 GntR family transcriptional regulator [Oceanispirochaeta sp. M1]RDG34026.1 GntR family transcriptional regulator [Oceanispirochaeta sp. M1]
MAKQNWGENVHSKTASETVYAMLHRNIINLNLIPGTVMSEKDISEKMNVSRTPVREAFIRLSNEALVTVVPQKGSFVSKINLARVKEERFLRESLENSVLYDLIMHHEKLKMYDLYENVEEQEVALSKGETTRFIELDDEFHSMLFRKADKSMCYNVIMSFSSHYRRVRYLSMSVSGVSISNLKHHQEMLELIKARNLEKAVTVMKIHLRKLDIEKDVIYQKYSDYFEDSGSLDLVDEKELFQDLNR